MPELPEVRTIVNKMNLDLSGSKITEVIIHLPKLLKNISEIDLKDSLIGCAIEKVTNKGKYIIFLLDSGGILISHLKLEGKYRKEKWPTELNKHDHLVIILDDDSALIYNDTRQFGSFNYYRNSVEVENNSSLRNLANEPDNTDPNWLFSKLQRKTIPIKSALLDQSTVVGLGNIYVDEVLWDSKIHPETPSCFINFQEVKELLKSSSIILERATKEGGSSIRTYLSYNGVMGNYQNFLQVHTKVGKPCTRDGSIIKKIKVNGRGTYLCEVCQIKKKNFNNI